MRSASAAWGAFVAGIPFGATLCLGSLDAQQSILCQFTRANHLDTKYRKRFRRYTSQLQLK